MSGRGPRVIRNDTNAMATVHHAKGVATVIRLSKSPTIKTCQLCGRGPLIRFEVPDSAVLWRCDDCELYQYGHLVDQRAYESDYHAGYARRRTQKIRSAKIRLSRLLPLVAFREESVAESIPNRDRQRRRLSNIARLRLTEPTGKSAPSLLEVGCSVGCTLEAATQLGWHATGVDISQDAVDLCRSFDLNAHHVGPLELPFPDHSFDVVASWHVIEHVKDVRETLREWRRVLKPGGLMMLETPDASCPKVRRMGSRYRKFWAPEHTYTFTPKNLAEFVQKAGMNLLQAPTVRQLSHLQLTDALYGTMYQSYMSLRRLAGVGKAFQLVAQRPLKETHAV